MIDREEVLKLVNAAREVYGCAPLDSIPRGERASPSFDPIARAFRRGADEWLFLAIGSRWLRLGACGKNSTELAARIHRAWFGAEHPFTQQAAEGGSIYVKLPQPIVDFISEFDAGRLPDFETHVADQEHARHVQVIKSCGELERFVKVIQRTPMIPRRQPRIDASSAA